MTSSDLPKSFSLHLSELRLRALIYLLTVVILSLVGFYFYTYIINILLLPLKQKLFFTSPSGGLELMIKVSLLTGLIFSLPMLVYQILRFTEPALPSRFKLRILPYLFFSLFLTLAGLGFAYFIGLPSALHFLSGFNSDQIQSLITTNEYFAFISRYLLGFAFIFQFPLILFIINSFYLVRIKSLLKFQRFVVIISLIIAAILTPTPDLINQIIMTLPLILLFYLSVLVIYFTNRRVA